MATPVRPTNRGDFHIAIICAFPRELDTIALLLDDLWGNDGYQYGRAPGDRNTYITGRMGNHNVVIVFLSNTGTSSAASAAVGLRSSYGGIKLALLVGTCSGVPNIDGYDAMLGDVVISKSIIQYDYGRQYPGSYIVKKEIEDSLGRASKDIRGLLAIIETEMVREQLQTKATAHLKRIQATTAVRKRRRADYRYPGVAEDRLFRFNYRHAHRISCDLCAEDKFCELALKTSCATLGCDKTHLVERERVIEEAKYTPEIFVGRVGSGNTVIQSGEQRDRIAAAHDIIAFEMEGAGVWDEVPCLVVKGICDYADSHKNKKWQDFAAATAASVARAILERYTVSDDIRTEAHGKNGEGQGSGNRSISGNIFGNGARISQGDVYHWHSWISVAQSGNFYTQ